MFKKTPTYQKDLPHINTVYGTYSIKILGVLMCLPRKKILAYRDSHIGFVLGENDEIT